MGLGYKASPILWPSEDEAESTFLTPTGFRVGDAGPLVGVGEAAQLHAGLAHPGHTVLVQVGEADDAETGEWLKMARYVSGRFGPHVKAIVLRRKGEPTVRDLLVDASGTAHARLAGGDGPCLCAVLPDGYLGLRLRPPAHQPLEAYFARIFA